MGMATVCAEAEEAPRLQPAFAQQAAPKLDVLVVEGRGVATPNEALIRRTAASLSA